MSLKVYSLDQAEEWDRIVRSFNDYDVYYLSGYVRAFEIHGDGTPILFCYEDANCRGINVVMKRDISEDVRFNGVIESNLWFDFVTPYGYGGWLIEGDDNTLLFEIYEDWCRRHGIVSEFVRYHPVLKNNVKAQASYAVRSLGGTIAMDISDPHTIWENLTSKNRNIIRKALKSGVTVYNGRYPEIFEKFRNIYNATMDKDNADAYYYFKPEFYASIMKDLPSEAQVFYAELEGRVIAAAIMLCANGRMNYHLSGSLMEFHSLAPTNLILYRAAIWGSMNGYRSLHLGGGVGSQEDSLYSFKKAFYRGEPQVFCIGKKIFLQQKYGELCRINEDNRDLNSNFFPEYRA